MTERGKDARIRVNAEMWVRDGEWQILVRAPEWVINDFYHHSHISPTRRIWLHNIGGGMGSYSFLLGTQAIQPSRRERVARRLLRFPYPKVVRNV